MQKELEVQLLSMLKLANKGVAATPKIAKELIREYQMQQLTYAAIGLVIAIISAIVLVRIVKYTNDRIDKYRQLPDDDRPLSWDDWSFGSVLGAGVCGSAVIVGVIVIIACLPHAAAPGISLINHFISGQ